MEENPNRSKTLLMPSPFPGMDPYVESPDCFPCLHDCLIFGILESLQLQIRTGQALKTGEDKESKASEVVWAT